MRIGILTSIRRAEEEEEEEEVQRGGVAWRWGADHTPLQRGPGSLRRASPPPLHCHPFLPLPPLPPPTLPTLPLLHLSLRTGQGPPSALSLLEKMLPFSRCIGTRTRIGIRTGGSLSPPHSQSFRPMSASTYVRTAISERMCVQMSRI